MTVEKTGSGRDRGMGLRQMGRGLEPGQTDRGGDRDKDRKNQRVGPEQMGPKNGTEVERTRDWDWGRQNQNRRGWNLESRHLGVGSGQTEPMGPKVGLLTDVGPWQSGPGSGNGTDGTEQWDRVRRGGVRRNGIKQDRAVRLRDWDPTGEWDGGWWDGRGGGGGIGSGTGRTGGGNGTDGQGRVEQGQGLRTNRTGEMHRVGWNEDGRCHDWLPQKMHCELRAQFHEYNPRIYSLGATGPRWRRYT